MIVTFPDSPYELHQPFEPAGDQPEAIDKLVQGLTDGLSFQTLLGVTGSGKTYTMANVIARTGRPALVLAPNKTLAAQLYSEFREFFPHHAAIRRLAEMQYQRAELEFRRGTFRVRGDVLDIFPAENAENAVRVCLFDDEVESVQLFDPLTGHLKQKMTRYTIFPSSHYVTGRQKVLNAIEAVKQELALQKEFFVSQMKLVEAQRIEQRTRFDLEMMNEIGFCKGIE